MIKAKKIEIVYTESNYWYHDLIGCTFNVDTESEENYYVVVGGVKGYYSVKKRHAKVVEWTKLSYANKQAEWIKKNNLKIGSKIKFIHEFEGWKYGFNYYNPEGYLYSKNRVYTIKEINNDHIKIEESSYPMPYFAFEPIKNEYRRDDYEKNKED